MPDFRSTRGSLRPPAGRAAAVATLLVFLASPALAGQLAGAPEAECSAEGPYHVMTTVTYQYLDVFANWLHFYKDAAWGMRFKPVLEVIAEDQEAFEVLSLPRMRRYLPAGAILVNGAPEPELASDLKGDIGFRSDKFKRLMTRRGQYILERMRTTCRIIFSDADAFWLKPPDAHFVGDCELWAQAKHRNGDPDSVIDKGRPLNPGFFAAVRTPQTLWALNLWASYLAQGAPSYNLPKFNEAVKDTKKLKACMLDEHLYPEGNVRWSESMNADGRMIVLHNNFLSGKMRKIQRFREAGFWPCDYISGTDPSMAARRRVFLAAMDPTRGPAKISLSQTISLSRFWKALRDDPALAKDASLASHPLTSAAPPDAWPPGHVAERAVDRILRRFQTAQKETGSATISFFTYMQAFYK